MARGPIRLAAAVFRFWQAETAKFAAIIKQAGLQMDVN